MGLLVDGKWHDTWYDTKSTGGRFVRKDSAFRGWIRADGSTEFAPEPGRYHLYVSLACPWAHRTLIYRKLKRLEDVISVSVVHPFMGAEGWSFENPDQTPGCVPDTVNGARVLHEVYTRADPHYTGRVTIPLLWDRERGTIVNNESSEIIRMLGREFDAYGDASLDFHPERLLAEIDELNAFVYPRINNGVYRCGFATTQEAYAEAFGELFAALDRIEQRLGAQRYLVGDRITEADWRLFTTLLRFDPVYFGHFKCNRQRIADTLNIGGKEVQVVSFDGVPTGPTWHGQYFLGADGNGRDVMVRLLYGARNSLFIGITAALITMLLAVLLGVTAGYFRGWTDAVISRAFDVMWAFPVLLQGPRGGGLRGLDRHHVKALTYKARECLATGKARPALTFLSREREKQGGAPTQPRQIRTRRTFSNATAPIAPGTSSPRHACGERVRVRG